MQPIDTLTTDVTDTVSAVTALAHDGDAWWLGARLGRTPTVATSPDGRRWFRRALPGTVPASAQVRVARSPPIGAAAHWQSPTWPMPRHSSGRADLSGRSESRSTTRGAAVGGRSASPRVVLHASHTVIAHSVVAPATCSADQPGGDAAPVLQVADRPLGDGGDAPTRRSARRAPRGRGPGRAGATAAAAIAPTAIHTTTPWTRVTVVIARSKRRASSSPACGPAPVTTVPATIANPVHDDHPTQRAAGCAARPRRPARPSSGCRHGRRSTTAFGHEDHRQQEVALHGQRVQVDQHGDPAEHDLADARRRPGRATAR